MDFKRQNKISESVKLQQIVKKWRRLASSTKSSKKIDSANNSNKSIKFLKRTLSFAEGATRASKDTVPKGFLAVSVGDDLKRYVIPMEYLGHRAFDILLKEAEEEFGFQQQGVLRIPCEVSAFEKILKLVEENKDTMGFCSSESRLSHSHHHPQSPMCR